MKIEELRIGNIIYRKPYEVTYLYYGKVGEFEVDLCFFGDLSARNIYIEEFEPIILTGEWLLRFGFELNEPGYDKGDFDMRNYGDYWIEHGLQLQGLCPAIKYVHQLQNIYHSLTGQELTNNQH